MPTYVLSYIHIGYVYIPMQYGEFSIPWLLKISFHSIFQQALGMEMEWKEALIIIVYFYHLLKCWCLLWYESVSPLPLVVDRYRLHDKYSLLLLSLDGLMCAWVLWWPLFCFAIGYRLIIISIWILLFIIVVVVTQYSVFVRWHPFTFYWLDIVHNIMPADVSHSIFYWYLLIHGGITRLIYYSDCAPTLGYAFLFMSSYLWCFVILDAIHLAS